MCACPAYVTCMYIDPLFWVDPSDPKGSRKNSSLFVRSMCPVHCPKWAQRHIPSDMLAQQTNIRIAVRWPQGHRRISATTTVDLWPPQNFCNIHGGPAATADFLRQPQQSRTPLWLPQNFCNNHSGPLAPQNSATSTWPCGHHRLSATTAAVTPLWSSAKTTVALRPLRRFSVTTTVALQPPQESLHFGVLRQPIKVAHRHRASAEFLRPP